MNQSRAAISALGVLAFFGVILSGCTGPGEPGPSLEVTPFPPMTVTPHSPTTPELPGSATSVIDGNNQFALELYEHLANDPEHREENLFFSPFSISSALAITYEGARGTTADEIRSVFHFPENQSVMRSGFAGVIAGINSKANTYTLRTANALWAEKTYPFLSEYISAAEQHYGATTTNLDFINMPEESRVTINTWVEDQTEERIRDLLQPGTIDPLTRLVITNAIYFKGTWVKQFDENKTGDADFRTETGKTVRVRMMQRTDEDARYGYAETETLQALSMPYESGEGKEISMLIILPKNDGISMIEKSLNASMLSSLQDSLMTRRVMVYFPKFVMETKYSLPAALSAMGMPTAFTGAADFSGMDGMGNLYIDDVVHQAFVEVNEEGTEAAAATAVVMQLSAMPMEEPTPVFRADHPFIFFIQDNETGNILFMGRVTNPAA
ncbi:MAG: Serpin (serine protease inhibitor) [Methanoregulaceae archaeon PtaU1.Bin059]|nr:MAG: Serpin (serine protease inhibitor) [Methanoregulaceae archaeon PtaU1.Bin059]